MSQKRQQDEGKASEDKRQKEVMTLQKAQSFMVPVLEPLIRRVVKEEVESALRKYLTSMKRSCGKEIQPSESRSLQLKFLNALSLPVFTGTRIEGEECTTLKLALSDAVTGQVVSSGPESSAKVEIVVLEGDFDGDEGDNWVLEEFRTNTVREREGKKSLLSGDVILNLKEGIGFVGEISFTDNSSWTRSRKFRLGARVVDNCDGIRIREAKTDSFIVRDHRGELYKKHHPPSLFDEVWRLEKIGKEGAFHKRLSRENVSTVRDFLILLFVDPTTLRSILGTGMSTKMWEITVEHARTCVLDKKLYLYPPGSQQKTRVVFNVVGQLMGLFSDDQYVRADNLSETRKACFSYHLYFLILCAVSLSLCYCIADALNLIISAYKNWEEVVAFDDETSLVDGSSRFSNTLYPSNPPMAESSDRFDYPQLSGPSPDIMPSIFAMGSSLDDYGLQTIDTMDVRFDQSMSFSGHGANSLICDTDSICENEVMKYFDECPHRNSGLDSQADLQSAVSGFLFPRSTAVADKKAQRRWTMLFSVLTWFSMLRKDGTTTSQRISLNRMTLAEKETSVHLLQNRDWLTLFTDKSLHLSFRNSQNEIHTSDPRRFKLQFFNKISSPVLTKETIQGVDGASIPVAIVDCHTGQVVTSGPAALAEVDIMVLKGDPDNVNGEDWTSEVFEKKIVREIEGKKNLLKGSLRLKLKEGVSSAGEIYFTHNRHWMKKCHFRLGARVVNNDLGVAVKEAKTDPFLVKDNRKKYDEKHFPPSLSDEVWRLKTICRKGKRHQQLSKANINTVKDFLTSFNNDPKRLQQILGPGAKLKEPVNHARTCIVTDKIYLYNSPNLEPSTGVVFNVVGQVQGILSECQYLRTHMLSEGIKAWIS
ncbi:hypothetical protein RJ639_037631 [Escallonia herrerae]|uniref:Uncharacterized protein n=1 Tax=Escallonia herrerae TaxID=1293975 RepID=A0AA88WS80_9ASTE|nr:hypothetical protein RJ639_037631 [Escallonia herrerae]